jgi:hypothetical protein
VWRGNWAAWRCAECGRDADERVETLVVSIRVGHKTGTFDETAWLWRCKTSCINRNMWDDTCTNQFACRAFGIDQL